MIHEKPWQVELLLSWVLRIGVIASSLTILLGIVLLLATHDSGYGAAGSGQLSAAIYSGAGISNAGYPTSLRDTVEGARQMRPFAIIALGLLMLIATPMCRVAASVAAFIVRRDAVYAAFTAFVLLMLLAGFMLGKPTE